MEVQAIKASIKKHKLNLTSAVKAAALLEGHNIIVAYLRYKYTEVDKAYPLGSAAYKVSRERPVREVIDGLLKKCNPNELAYLYDFFQQSVPIQLSGL